MEHLLKTVRSRTRLTSSLLFFSLPPDNISYRSGSVRLAGLHQPPGAEDLSVQPAARPLQLPSPHLGRLGNPQRSEWQAFLLQPCHRRAHLEAATHQGHEQQH